MGTGNSHHGHEFKPGGGGGGGGGWERGEDYSDWIIS